MRLLGVHRWNYRLGGAEAVHLDHMALFRENGWTCAEFAMAHPLNEPSAFAGYFPPLFDPMQARGLGRIGAAARMIHSRDVAQRFAALIADFRPDIIHTHGAYWQLTAAIYPVARQAGVPVVMTLHDYELLCPAYHFFRADHGACEACPGGRQWNAVRHACLHGSRAVSAVYAVENFIEEKAGRVRDAVAAYVCPSQFLRDKFIAHGFPAERLHHVANFFQGADDAPPAPEAVALARATHGRFLLCFGRLSAEKGLPVLVEAAHRARRRLVLAGQGPQEDALRAQVAALGADVVFTGHVKGGELWALVEAAEAVAVPSVCYENAPKALLEAKSRGKVVIATATGGLPETISDGETGFLVPKGDAPALAATIERVFSLPPAAREAIGMAARRETLARYTRQAYYDDMLEVYEAVLGRSLNRATNIRAA